MEWESDKSHKSFWTFNMVIFRRIHSIMRSQKKGKQFTNLGITRLVAGCQRSWCWKTLLLRSLVHLHRSLGKKARTWLLSVQSISQNYVFNEQPLRGKMTSPTKEQVGETNKAHVLLLSWHAAHFRIPAWPTCSAQVVTEMQGTHVATMILRQLLLL